MDTIHTYTYPLVYIETNIHNIVSLALSLSLSPCLSYNVHTCASSTVHMRSATCPPCCLFAPCYLVGFLSTAHHAAAEVHLPDAS